MPATVAELYLARFRTVLAYIDSHLDEELSVVQLSRVAAFSPSHFHRQFAALFGLGVYQYVQLLRLKRASYQLAFRQHNPIIEIALASGYDSPEAFSRAFKNSLGQTPSAFRKLPQWQAWHDLYQHLTNLRLQHMAPTPQPSTVTLVEFPATRVAAYEHRGDPRLLGNSLRSFINWRKQNKLPPTRSATFNILYDNPAETAPADYRLDICAATEYEIASNDSGVIAKIIPAGRCAVLRHIGSDDTLAASVNYLYADWLPQSGETLRDFPLFLQRVRFFPEVPEHEAIVDVFLPLA